MQNAKVYTSIASSVTALFNLSLCDARWGFSSGKGTVTTLLATTHQWLKLLEDRNVCALFFDFHKAFDLVSHIPLLTKLSQLGLDDENIVHWVIYQSTYRVGLNPDSDEFVWIS